MLKITDVWKSYGTGAAQQDVLRGVSLDLQPGETLALTGESGSGKSTLLHLAGALDQPDRGEITVDGVALSNQNDRARAALRRESFGFIFQQFSLVPSMKVESNVAFLARLAGREDPAWSAEVARRLGIADLAHRWPEELSGGQQQRVAIARALAARPRWILADEPTGNLDEDSSARVLDLMLQIVSETGSGLFMVTHSASVAAQLGAQLHLARGHLA